MSKAIIRMAISVARLSILTQNYSSLIIKKVSKDFKEGDYILIWLTRCAESHVFSKYYFSQTLIILLSFYG